MIHKVIISVLIGIEVLTLFPAIFFGIYTVVNSGDIKSTSTFNLMVPLVGGVLYIMAVLFGGYQAFQKLKEKIWQSYLFALLPALIVGLTIFVLWPR